MKHVEVSNLQQLLDESSVVVVDVRDAGAYQEAHIPGAVNIPVDQLHVGALPEFAGKKIVVHCGGGTRAARAYNALTAEDDSLDVYVLQGGMRSWREAALPVKQKA